MKKAIIRLIPISAFAVIYVSCFAAEPVADASVERIDGVHADLVPVRGKIYLIDGQDLYKAGQNPGPASMELGIAWRIANEFVFRTALRTTYKLPAGSSGLKNDRDAVVVFTPNQGEEELAVLVHWKERKVEISSRDLKSKAQPGE